MRIYSEQGPNGVTSYTIDLDGKENANFRFILEGWLDALEFHERKSRDYDERGDEGTAPWNLGLKGEWPGITRKIQKLHKIIWKGKDVLFEGAQEIMMDLMGALGLLLMEQKKISDKYNAGWRINGNNRPTFGPGKEPGSISSILSPQIPGVGTEETNPLICTHGGNHEFIGMPSACGKCGRLKRATPPERNPGY